MRKAPVADRAAVITALEQLAHPGARFIIKHLRGRPSWVKGCGSWRPPRRCSAATGSWRFCGAEGRKHCFGLSMWYLPAARWTPSRWTAG